MNNSNLENSNYDEHKSKKRSLVWNFFEKISQQRVKCRICEHEQNYQGTTGNILRHLKARHNLDVTIKGQQDPQNQERIKELSQMTKLSFTTTQQMNVDRKPKIKHNPSESSDTNDTQDIYNENNNDDVEQDNDRNQESFEKDEIFCENLPEFEEDYFSINNKLNVIDHDQKSARRTKLEEDRIIAETEYFREKAAYFRLQKHLTALQAKKIKLEINEIVMNNKNLNLA
ncbi:uncharacterized protein ACRADG_010759 isoform 1-T2 [Cochliomyia hominivorax]